MKKFFILISLLSFAACSASNNDSEKVEDLDLPEEEAVAAPEVSLEIGEEKEQSDVREDGPESLEESFYALPDQYFMAPLTEEERQEAIVVLDPDNYYLEFQPRMWDGSGSFAIFIDPDGDYLYALETKGCGPICEQELYFLQWMEGSFVDVTEQYLPTELDLSPPAADAEFAPLFVLPQFGTRIEVINQYDQEVLAELVWTGGRFSLEQ